MSAAEADSIYIGISANKTVENQLKVVPGAAPELRSAARYDNGTDAEVELAFDENVSAVRTLNVSTVGGDANLTESVSVSEGRVVATLDGVHTDDLEVAYDVVDDVGNGYVTNRTAAVQFAAVTMGVGDDDTVYEGSTLAVLTDRTNASVAVDAADDSTGQSGSTGANSKVYLVDTGTLDRGAYDVVYGGDGDRNATFGVESLGLAVDADDATVTNDDGAAVAGTVSANASDRSVAVELRTADGDVVATDAGVLDGSGEYDYVFEASGLAVDDYAVVAVDDVSGARSRVEPVVVSDPPSDDDSEYGDYRDPTATPSPTSTPSPAPSSTPVPTERSAADTGSVVELSGERVAADATPLGDAETRETGTDGAPDAEAESESETETATTQAGAPTPSAASAVPSEPDSGTTTGTEVPGFGAGAAAAALFLCASLAALTARRDR